jgi:hypothetical protein
MVGPRITTVFKSRWNALFWASSVLLTAYCSVPSENEPGDAEQIAALVAATQKPAKAPEHHANPWAKSAD